MISVYFDYQILFAQRYGGISRYFFELASRLPDYGAKVSIGCVHNHNYYFSEKLGITDTSNSNKLFRLAERGIFWYVNRIKSLREVRAGRYDIIHPTYYYVDYTDRNSAKLIIDIHDMIPEKYINIYPEINKNIIAAKKKVLYEADMIISVSENTKRDLLEIYPDINPEKIMVIYRGDSAIPVDDNNDNNNINFTYMNDKPYVLFVGLRGMYKNFRRFAKSMSKILAAHKDLQVFCAGGGAFTNEEREIMGKYSSRFHQANLNDQELFAAYSNAVCFVFPSEYEGFGIPILEAFAYDCPIVCSNTSSLPEVAQDAAEYFDPVDVDSMTEKILHVIESQKLQDELRSLGRDRLKFFSWDKSAGQTLECYKFALNQ